MTTMNRAEARALCREICFDGGRRAELKPWTRIPVTCAQCDAAPTHLISFDGAFLCDHHADIRLDDLVDEHGGASSQGLWGHPSWRNWLWGRLRWRPYYWLTLKQGPVRPFMVRRGWYRACVNVGLFKDRFDRISGHA